VKVLYLRTHVVMNRINVAIFCTGHGIGQPHLLSSRSVDMQDVRPIDQLWAIQATLDRLVRLWSEGEWDFTDDC
jgi:hypothetical protein